MIGSKRFDAALPGVGQCTLGFENIEVGKGAPVVAVLRQRKRSFGLWDYFAFGRTHGCRVGLHGTLVRREVPGQRSASGDQSKIGLSLLSTSASD